MATKDRTKLTKPKRPPAAVDEPVAPGAGESAAVAPPDAPPPDAVGPPDGTTAQPLLPDTPELVRELPEEVLSFLVRTTPSRALWDWLTDDDRVALLHTISRGFQRTLNVLRQPVVRNRLVRHLYDKPDDFSAVLRLWGAGSPPPQVVGDIRSLDDDSLVEQLPELWHRYGAESLLLSLMLDNRRTALDALDRIAEAEDEAARNEADGGAVAPAATASSPLTEQRRALVRRTDKRRADDTAPLALPARLPDAMPPPDWQERAILAETRLQAAHLDLAQARLQLNDAQQELHRTTQIHKRELYQVQQKLESSEAQLQETKKQFDRTARRLKSVQREEEELATDSKRFKRQLRRQQQLNEELRKQLANVTARLQSLTPPPATTPAPAATPAGKPSGPAIPRRPQVSPLDQTFIWHSDGRPFRITPREVKRAIDRNDEEFVFTLIQAFDALRETNEQGYRMFLDRIREFDRYYSRVLTVDTTRVLVDASNVVRYETNRFGKGQLRHLLAMRDELRRRDCFPIRMYADASLPYHVDEPAELHQMVKSGEVQMSNSGQEADELLAREARRTGAYVVTNDRSFHTKVAPDFEPPRITFRIHDGFLVVDEF